MGVSTLIDRLGRKAVSAVGRLEIRKCSREVFLERGTCEGRGGRVGGG